MLIYVAQDDEVDWKRASAKMGLIYETSRLTITATAAENASEGCFVSAPARPAAATLSYFHRDWRAAELHVRWTSR